MKDLEKIYKRRFSKDIDFRKKMYKLLCSNFFQKYIPKNAIVLDVAAGYCEFANSIKAKKKIALDLNSDVKKFANNDVEVILSSSTNMNQIKNETIDIAFTSNFFEHLDKDNILKTINELHRVLKKDGKFLILQPNIRYCYKDYWMFFDHITPLDDRSLSEVLEVNGFKIMECKPKFLPYTTKSKLLKSIFLLKIYLMMPIIQRIMGKQAFIYAKKI
ncbi:MAG: methyltransferase domain-containing protein [Nanoarchaeota archaeon]|nr:class I SAM-dependent methyltransferase [Nanoarchaeota archaeon]MBU1030838.1 class I SAM-dependent methyltransferase [Nanoarchaeota archaeon]MBU1849152.1 class I SAM-dependent methyltransferase [Nanoarchaeota archaeon]